MSFCLHLNPLLRPLPFRNTSPSEKGEGSSLLISPPPPYLLPLLFTSQQGKPVTNCTGLYDIRAYQMYLCGTWLNRQESNQWAIYKLLRSRPCYSRERNPASYQVRSTRPTRCRNHPRPSSPENCERSLIFFKVT